MERTENRPKSFLLVGAQFLCLGVLLVTGPLLPDGLAERALVGVGLGLAVWALVTMSPRSLTAFPDVRPGGVLATNGPYRYIRHPMYTAVLLLTLGLVLGHASLLRLIVWLVLAVNLWVKLSYEERLLAQRFPDYPAYRAGTKRLIPFLL
ncbi:MAG: isoprenylcysteine carboxylmethyltransferase family protein [Nitrospira sp.]|nr:isoprenylcysteine carboxylmethyltransferase family protein [Nitrospira sp.]